jgi:hypothetical protein
VTSDKLRQPIEKCAIGHFLKTLQTKDVKIHKVR